MFTIFLLSFYYHISHATTTESCLKGSVGSNPIRKFRVRDFWKVRMDLRFSFERKFEVGKFSFSGFGPKFSLFMVKLWIKVGAFFEIEWGPKVWLLSKYLSSKFSFAKFGILRFDPTLIKGQYFTVGANCENFDCFDFYSKNMDTVELTPGNFKCHDVTQVSKIIFYIHTKNFILP